VAVVRMKRMETMSLKMRGVAAARTMEKKVVSMKKG